MVKMFKIDDEKIDNVDVDDDDDDDGNYKVSGPQKSESVFFFVFLSQLEDRFFQISRLLVFQDQYELECLAKKIQALQATFSLISVL